MTLTCVFWDVTKGRAWRTSLGQTGGGYGLRVTPSLPSSMSLFCPGPTGDWASRGCSTQLGAEQTVCRCDHLTFFALLLVTPPPPRRLIPGVLQAPSPYPGWGSLLRPEPLGCLGLSPS